MLSCRANGEAPSSRRWPFAFTLVELLVVLAVIGVLAALLLPALARGKVAAQRVRCVANLHQLGLAAQMYWDDHGGRTFRYRGAFTNGGDLYWFGWLARGAEGTRAFDATQGALFPYLGGRGVEVCPSLDYRGPWFKRKATGAAYGYGYNLHLAPLGGDTASVSSCVERPSGVGLFADAAQVNTFQSPASPDNPLLEEFYYVCAEEPTTHFRHSQRANVVFCDGHVGSESMAPSSLDDRLPQANVGRLRPAILLGP